MAGRKPRDDSRKSRRRSSVGSLTAFGKVGSGHLSGCLPLKGDPKTVFWLRKSRHCNQNIHLSAIKHLVFTVLQNQKFKAVLPAIVRLVDSDSSFRGLFFNISRILVADSQVSFAGRLSIFPSQFRSSKDHSRLCPQCHKKYDMKRIFHVACSSESTEDIRCKVGL